MRRSDNCIYVSPADRPSLSAIVGDRNSASKLIWQARIILATADGHGTNAIVRLKGKSKPCVWRWQEGYVEEAFDRLLRDKTRPSRIPPLSEATRLAVIAKTANETPADATYWSRETMAAAMGISA